MTWEVPPDFFTGRLFDADDANHVLRDNMTALKAPPIAHYEGDTDSDYTTSSGSFVDIGSAWRLTITTESGDLMVIFQGCFEPTSNLDRILLDVEIDGERVGGDGGILGPQSKSRVGAFADEYILSFFYLLRNLGAGQHEVAIQWRTNNSNTITMRAGGGTYDVVPQLVIWELS